MKDTTLRRILLFFLFVLIVLVAIVITPGGDPISSSILSVLMYGLFEGSLQLMRLRRSKGD